MMMALSFAHFASLLKDNLCLFEQFIKCPSKDPHFYRSTFYIFGGFIKCSENNPNKGLLVRSRPVNCVGVQAMWKQMKVANS